MNSAERKTEILKNGWYAKPRCLLWLRKTRAITKSEYELLDILLHLENIFVAGDDNASKRGRWFFSSNKDIIALGLLSEKPLKRSKKSLKDKGFIDYRPGHTAHATQYRILDIEGNLPEGGS